jgi:hypothetical protein
MGFCPECNAEVGTEAQMIVHFNDDHGFDFLMIANKLEEVHAP